MRNVKQVAFAVCLFCSFFAAAKDRKWQDAAVLKLSTSQGATVAVVVPVGNGLAGAAGQQTASFYWIKAKRLRM